jgi:hypothetical protein
MSWQAGSDIDVKEYRHWKENGYAFSVVSPSELMAEHLAREEAANPRPDKEKIMNTRLEQMTCGDTIRARGGVRCLGYGEDGTMHFEVESESHDKLYRVRIHVQGRSGIRCLGYDGDGVMCFEGDPDPLDEIHHFRMYSGPEGTVEDGTVMADCECEGFRLAAGAVGYINARMRGDTDRLDVFILDDLPLCQHIWAALGQHDIRKEQELIRFNNWVKAREGYVIKAVGVHESRYYLSISVEDIRRMRVEGWVFTVTSSAELDSLSVLNDHPLNWL